MKADRNAPIIETRVLNDPDEFERHLTSLTNGYTTSIVIPPPSSSVGSNPDGDPYRNLAYLNGDLEMLAVMVRDIMHEYCVSPRRYYLI